jgi:16S rRNA (guanine966-N2)-methyltransferase
MAQGSLRVHGGEAGGRRLVAPPGIRPSEGVVKEAIFNVLGGAVLDATALDLCAGSGALGIEALSRGAGRAVFVERAERAVVAIRRNLATLDYQDRGRVFRAEVARWLEGRPADVARCGLVLFDPPYNDPVVERVLRLLDRLCAEGTIVVAEHGVRQALPVLARLRAVRDRRYGDTQVTFLEAGP